MKATDLRPKTKDQLKEELMQVLRESFRPEFINRIDEIIVFRALDDRQLAQITRLLLDKLARRLRAADDSAPGRERALANGSFRGRQRRRPDHCRRRRR